MLYDDYVKCDTGVIIINPAVSLEDILDSLFGSSEKVLKNVVMKQVDAGKYTDEMNRQNNVAIDQKKNYLEAHFDRDATYERMDERLGLGKFFH